MSSLHQHYAPSTDFDLSAGASHEQLHSIVEQNIEIDLLSEFAVAMADSMSEDSLDTDVPKPESNEAGPIQQETCVSPARSKTATRPSAQTSQMSKLDSVGYNDTEPWDSDDDEPSITRASCSTSKPYDLSMETEDVLASGSQGDSDCRSDDDVASDPSYPRRRGAERDNSCGRGSRRRIVRNRQKSGLTSSARTQLGTVYRLPKLSNAVEASRCLADHIQQSESDGAQTAVDKALLVTSECEAVNVTNTQAEGLADNPPAPTTEWSSVEVNRPDSETCVAGQVSHSPCEAITDQTEENCNDVLEIEGKVSLVKSVQDSMCVAPPASDNGTSPSSAVMAEAERGIDSTPSATNCDDFIHRLLIDTSANESPQDDDAEPKLGERKSSSAIQKSNIKSWTSQSEPLIDFDTVNHGMLAHSNNCVTFPSNGVEAGIKIVPLHLTEPQKLLNFDDGSAGDVSFVTAEPSEFVKPLVSFSDECLHQVSSRHVAGSFDGPHSLFDAHNFGFNDDDASDVRLRDEEERGEIASHNVTRNASEFDTSTCSISTLENVSNLTSQQEDKVGRLASL
jgi:hypothetical protein